MNRIEVSVIVPIYNEERFIDKCICSLLEQDYAKKDMELIFVDGGSSDKSLEILNSYKKKYQDLIFVFVNKNKTVPYAMNIGINNSKGDYIIRIDAHAEYAKDYISKCVYYLKNTDAENVGGILETKANGRIGSAIAKMLSSKFGVGNSGFRIGSKDGYTDTVPFGAFKKEVFNKYGKYDERLTRNQDNEMNYRIRKNGGKIYLSNNIKASYYCRDSVIGICDMGRKNGKWNIITMKLCPGSMGIRHFVPLCFVLSILIFTFFGFYCKSFRYILFFELLIYFLLDCFFSVKTGANYIERYLLLFLYPLFHINYGIGSLFGIKELLMNYNHYERRYPL